LANLRRKIGVGQNTTRARFSANYFLENIYIIIIVAKYILLFLYAHLAKKMRSGFDKNDVRGLVHRNYFKYCRRWPKYSSRPRRSGAKSRFAVFARPNDYKRFLIKISKYTAKRKNSVDFCLPTRQISIPFQTSNFDAPPLYLGVITPVSFPLSRSARHKLKSLAPRHSDSGKKCADNKNKFFASRRHNLFFIKFRDKLINSKNRR